MNTFKLISSYMKHYLMTFVFLICSLLMIASGPSQAADLNSPDHIVNLCTEQCQYWDNFSNSCFYRTTCSLEGNLATYKKCQQWDNFSNQCANESVTKQYINFDPWGSSPSCTESCQYKDPFGVCLYQTSCTLTQYCASLKSCERWDQFSNTCVSERIDLACNIRN